MLYILRRISNSQILQRNIPESQRSTEGLDPDLEYLPQVTMAQPDYDQRYYTLETVEQITGEGAERVYQIGFSTVKRPVEEIKTHVENREALELHKHIKPQEQIKLAILVCFILSKKLENLSLTQREQAIFNRLAAAGQKLMANDARTRQLFTAIDANQEPAIDEGWVAE